MTVRTALPGVPIVYMTDRLEPLGASSTQWDCWIARDLRQSRPEGNVDAANGDAPLRLRLLGGFEVRASGRVADEDGWRVRKAKSIVKLVALAPSHRLDRDVLMDVLWPDLERPAAQNNLRFALHAARGALGEGALPSRGSLIALGQGDVSIDADVFERAATLALRTRDANACASALDLYGGELLPEDRYEDWSVSRRERLRDLHLGLLERAASIADASGEVATGREMRERLVASDATHELARAWLMRSYASTGERARAMRHYEQLVAALRSELDAEPDAELTRLHREIAGGR